MYTGLVLTVLALVVQGSPEAAAGARDWFVLQFSAGDGATVGAVIAAYVKMRERITRVETQVGPMWDSWNLRHSHHRGL